jgi:ketosteroid isomerase-like protein
MADRHDILRGAYAAFNSGDLHKVLAHLDPDIEWIEPEEFFAGGHYKGHAGVLEYLSRVRTRWAWAQSTPLEMTDIGDRVVVLVRAQVRPQPSAAVLEREIADVYTFKGDVAMHMQAYNDPQEALAACRPGGDTTEPGG